MTDAKIPLVTIIVPVFNEIDNVDVFLETLSGAIAPLADRFRFEFLFTDNHSSDGTFARLSDIAKDDERVRVLRFSRNFGYQNSILTGYRHARGDVAIQLDCDLQDPPGLIPQFLDKWREGYQVVYGIRRRRKEGRLITFARRVFYRLVNHLSDDELPVDAGDFRLIDRRILDLLSESDDRNPYLRGMIASYGFRQTGIDYDRDERHGGSTKFSIGEYVRLAVDGLVGHSIIPLRIATYVGMVAVVFTLGGIAALAIGHYIFGQDWPRGFAMTNVLILLGISLNALFLGIIGEYIARIYRQVRRSPWTIIERQIPASAENDGREDERLGTRNRKVR